MEITAYVDFIKEQFQEIATDFGFIWEQQNEGTLLLKKKDLTILFATHYRESGITISIRNLKKEEYFSLFDLAKKNGFETPFDCLSTDEKNINERYKGTIKYLIYSASIILKKHFKELLEGDFSSVGKGHPL